jgi:hypothetical protein
MTDKTTPAGIDLDKLEALARAAEKDGQHIYAHPRDSNKHADNEAWQRAASPEAFLALIDLARRAAPRVSEQADERALFEQYATSQGLRDFELNEFGSYRNPFTQGPYNYWRASRAALTQQAAPEAPATQQAGAADDMTAEQARAALQAMPLETVVGMVQGSATTASASGECDGPLPDERPCHLCDKSVGLICDEHAGVADGADAYGYACELMEEGWLERARRGVEIGTQGSLCDGIAWIFERLKQLESTPAPSREAAPLFDPLSTNYIKPWAQRMFNPENRNIQAAMGAEIADLRAALRAALAQQGAGQAGKETS